MAPKRATTASDGDEFAQIPQRTKETLGFDKTLKFIVLSAVASLTPLALHCGIYGLKITEWIWLIVAAVVLSVILLTQANTNSTLGMKEALMKKRNMGRDEKSKSSEKAEKVLQEGMFLALAENFSRFFALVVLFGVYILKSSPVYVNYTVTLLVSSGLVFYATMGGSR